MDEAFLLNIPRFLAAVKSPHAYDLSENMARMMAIRPNTPPRKQRTGQCKTKTIKVFVLSMAPSPFSASLSFCP